MNHLLLLAYHGGAYHGFQVQANARTVCQTLQDALQAVFGARPDVKGCSRTDAGVHARAFCLNFRQDTAIPHEKLPLALNAHLSGDIRVLRAMPVPEDFHARYAATGKQYEYRVLNSPVDDPFAAGLAHRAAGALDLPAMDRAAKHLLGTHDFAAFASAGGSVQDTVRTLTRLDVARQGRFVGITVAGNGFLYNMVRIIAGTLLEVGLGRLAGDEVPGILAGGRRAAAGPTLPACGLFLDRVFYPEQLVPPEWLDPDWAPETA
uniref:Putative tRNA pseudouridine synthase A n=1 Tax=termite gut metagenome TaxID=433724 RepID=S0DDW4_9ZZZZ